MDESKEVSRVEFDILKEKFESLAEFVLGMRDKLAKCNLKTNVDFEDLYYEGDDSEDSYDESDDIVDDTDSDVSPVDTEEVVSNVREF